MIQRLQSLIFSIFHFVQAKGAIPVILGFSPLTHGCTSLVWVSRIKWELNFGGSLNAWHLNWEEQKINGDDGTIIHKVKGLLLTIEATTQLTLSGKLPRAGISHGEFHYPMLASST